MLDSIPKSSRTTLNSADSDEEALWLPWVPQDHVQRAEYVEEGKGSRVRLSDDNWYLDASGGFSGINLGHGRKEVAEAFLSQASICAHFPLGRIMNRPADHLAKRLRELLASSLRWTFLTCSGSEAIESALKMAVIYQGCRGRKDRNGIAVMQGAYHGATLGALSVTQLERCRTGYSLLQPITVLECPTQVGLNAALAGLEDTFSREKQIGAVLVELVKGVGGVRPLPAAFVKRLSEICRATDTLLIVDEVLTGCGRTGKWFAYQHYGLSPDIVTVSKGLTGGYTPLAATIATDVVYQAIGKDELFGGFRHGHTYSGHAASCAAALATLEYIERDQILEHVERQAARLRTGLLELEGYPGVKEVRGLGLLVGVEFDSADQANRIHERCREKFVLTRNEGTTIAICPPLNISEEEIDLIVEAMLGAVR